MKLSEHFTLHELTRSFTATRLRIDNTPPPEVVANLARLARHLLEPIRERVRKPIIVTSGYRCSLLNKAVHGATNSAHMVGLAADIIVQGMPAYDLAELIYISDQPAADKVILEFGEWVHVQVPREHHPTRHLVFTALHEPEGQVKYQPGLVTA